MLAGAAYLLELLSIRNLGFAYFFLAPAFLNQGERIPLIIVFGLGHLFTFAILGLFLCRRLLVFDDRIGMGRPARLVAALVLVFLASVALNSPGHLLIPEKHFFWYLKFAFPACAFLLLLGVWTPRDLPRLFTLLAAMGAVSGLFLVTQMTLGFPSVFAPGRYSSYFWDPNGYVLLLDVLLAFTAPMCVTRMRAGSRYSGYLAINFLLLAGVLLTGSRGGFLMTSAILAATVLATRDRKLIVRVVILSLPLMGAFAAIVAGRYDSDATMSDFGRIWSYLVALGMIRENPLLGVGLGNVLERFADFGQLYAQMLGRSLEVHNAYLEIFAEGGVLAFGLYCVLVIAPTWALFRRVARPEKKVYPVLPVAGLNIMLAFIIYGMFYPEFLGHDDFWAYLCVVVLILRSRPVDGEWFAGVERPHPAPSSSASHRWAGSGG